MTTTILINGETSDGRIPVTDSSVLRGDGCFEVLKTYRARPFALGEHLDRLERSAKALEIDLPARSDLETWVTAISEELIDGAVRIVVTRGSSVPGGRGESNVIVFGHPWSEGQETVSLYPVTAPWHAADVDWALAGVKYLSYAPNLAATRSAVAAGYGDALLVTVDGMVLEGPTFSVAWVVDGVLETPSLDLGILDSITRRVVLDLARDRGIQVAEGRFSVSRLDHASEVMALSTIREVQPVSAIADRAWTPGPVTLDLAEGFAGLVG